MGSYSTLQKVYFEHNFFLVLLVAFRILVHQPGIKPACPAVEAVLTTGPPGKPLNTINSGKYLAIPSAYKLLFLVLGVGEPRWKDMVPAIPRLQCSVGARYVPQQLQFSGLTTVKSSIARVMRAQGKVLTFM